MPGVPRRPTLLDQPRDDISRQPPMFPVSSFLLLTSYFSSMSDLLTSDLRAPASGVSNVPEDMTGRPRRIATGGISFRKTFSALKHRNFRLYFAGQLISFTGTWMTTTAQGWLVYQLTGSKTLLRVVAPGPPPPTPIFAHWGVCI